VGQRLDQVAASHEDTVRALAGQADVLTTIAGRVYGQERVLAEHSAALASHGEMLAAQGATLAGHGELLASHCGMLAEILRRLPAG
jgi:hypothetical protein